MKPIKVLLVVCVYICPPLAFITIGGRHIIQLTSDKDIPIRHACIICKIRNGLSRVIILSLITSYHTYSHLERISKENLVSYVKKEKLILAISGSTCT